MENKRRIRITIIGILALILVVTGISFATFSADLAGEKVQSMNTGCLKVNMSDLGSINMKDAYPETDKMGLSEEPYIFEISNVCSTDAFYETTINVMEGSDVDNLSKVKIALNGDSYLAPTIENKLPKGELLDSDITGVVNTYKLDEGYLKAGESKSFELRTWFDYDVEEISGSLENKIIINSRADNIGAITYNKNTAGYSVLSKNTKLSGVNYSMISPSDGQGSGFVEVKNKSSVTYHFRGNPNNYLSFANNIYRIVSTNSDGSINIVRSDVVSNGTYNNLNTSLSTIYDDSVKSMEQYIKTDQEFCLENEALDGGYIASIRLSKFKPSVSCKGDTRSKIGLLTIDDLMFAGAVNGIKNTSFYLSNASGYITSTSKDASSVYGYEAGLITNYSKTSSVGIKPVVTIKADTIINGEGTSSVPFYVSGVYGDSSASTNPEDTNDTTAPRIDYARVDARWSNTNKTIEISAIDNFGGSGIAGYIVKTNDTKPSSDDSGFEASASQIYTTVNSYDVGTYYVFAKDEAGNVSDGKKVVIDKVDKIPPTCVIRISPNGDSSAYKTLSIITEDNNIDLEGFSWDHDNSTEDVVKVSTNGTYTGHITDLAGNKGSCTGVVTGVSVANKPVLSENMVPVYYDEDNEIWKKADVNNLSGDNKWYDYNNSKWANSITYNHATPYDSSNNYKGKGFNGTSYYDNLANANASFGKNITLMVRFKPKKTGAAQHLVSSAESGGAYIALTSANQVEFSIYGTTAKAYKLVASPTTFQTNRWYTAVGTYNGTTLKLFLDGVLVKSLNVSDTIKASTQPFFAGANPNANGTHSGFFYGEMSHVLVSKSAMSDSNVAKYFGSDFNYTKQTNDLVYKEYVGKKVAGSYDSTISFNGDGASYDGNTIMSTNHANYEFNKTITVASRFKISSGGVDQYVVSNAESGGFILSVGTDDKIYFAIYGATAKAYKKTLSTFTAEKGKWYDVVGTYDGTTIKLYIDGKLNSSLAVTDTIKPSVRNIAIGANPESAAPHICYFNGTISHAMVLDEVLSSDFISNNYNESFFNTDYESDNVLFAYDLQNYKQSAPGTSLSMSKIETMQVWVPRYKYKVFNYNRNGSTYVPEQRIDVVFEKEKTSTGDIKCEDNISLTHSETCKLITTNTECTDSTCNGKYYTHPAFTFGNDELNGIWVGKFETTGSINNITSKPDLPSITNQSVSSFYNGIKGMNSNANKYGFAISDDVHMMKNMEWGSVAYLEKSKYGLCKDDACTDNYFNNSIGFYTGRSSGLVTGAGSTYGTYTYDGYLLNSNTNTKSSTKDMSKIASTTGNIYGIYDMSGGAWDYLMANLVYPSSHEPNIAAAGFTSENYPGSKYVDSYAEYDETDNRHIAKLGDAIKEVGLSTSTGWGGVTNFLPYVRDIDTSIMPWMIRGKNATTDNSGRNLIFTSSRYTGAATWTDGASYYSSRFVISNR